MVVTHVLSLQRTDDSYFSVGRLSQKKVPSMQVLKNIKLQPTSNEQMTER